MVKNENQLLKSGWGELEEQAHIIPEKTLEEAAELINNGAVMMWPTRIGKGSFHDQLRKHLSDKG